MTALLLAASCVGALQASLLWEDNYFHSAYDIVTDGSVAYVATGDSEGVLVVDMSDPRSPTVLGACGDMAAASLALSGSMLYAVDGTSGMVCDVSIPSSPAVVGSFACPSWRCERVVAAGTNVYLQSGVYQVYVLDAANSSSPTLAGTYTPSNGYVIDIAASGKYLYASTYYNGLEVVDVSDPATPTPVGSYSESLFSLLVSGTTLYAGCNSNRTTICVLDITNTSPTPLGSVETMNTPSDMALSGTVLYSSGSDGLTVVDVSSAVSPTVVGSLAYSESMGRVASIGTTVLAASSSSHSLYVTDASVPSEPKFITAYGGGGNAAGVYVEGSVAVVCDEDAGTLRIYNVSNPSAATVLSIFYFQHGRAYKPVIVGQYAYVGTEEGLVVVNIMDPLAPSVTGYPQLYNVNSLWVGGQLAYLAYSQGLSIADVSDPTNIRIIGTLDLTEPVHDVTVVGTTAYIVGHTLGLVTVDVSSPLDPKQLGLVYTPGIACGVSVLGGVAYVAAGNGGLHVVDVSNVAAPTLLKYFDTGDARKVHVEGGLLYVADAKNGLYIYDVSDPTTPVLLDTAATNGVARDVYTVGTKVYVAARGLRIFDVSEGTPLPTTSVPGAVTPSPTGREQYIPSWVWALVAVAALLGALGGAAVAYSVLRTKAVDAEMLG